MRRLTILLASLGALTALLVSSAGATAAATPASYLILAHGKLPANLAAQVQQAGGTLTNTVPQVGIAVASSSDANFKAKASRLGTVVSNLSVQWVDPVRVVEGPAAQFGNPPASGDDDFFFDLQWGHDAVDAVDAWNRGYFGAGARVAVLDTGFDLDHPDLAPNINLGLSADMTGEGLQYTLPDPFSHGTHVAGTVAAADNAFGTIGVAPQAELVLVKVLGDAGSGTFEDVIEGIVHAADVDADVINMSLGASFPRRGFLDDMGTEDPSDDVFVTAREVQELWNGINRAVTYAYQHGTTVIASAGNDANDGDKDKDLLHLPSDASHAISIAATGPNGWALDATTDLDLSAFYTNFGRSVIDLAAPGGNLDFSLFPNPLPECTIAGLTRPCWVFDLVFSTGNDSWFWAAGTSMAAPHTSGVAAIIIGANGGSMHPAQVEQALKQSADDLDSPGQDPFYGAGRVNADNAVG